MSIKPKDHKETVFVIQYDDGAYNFEDGHPCTIKEATRYKTREEALLVAENLFDNHVVEIPYDYEGTLTPDKHFLKPASLTDVELLELWDTPEYESLSNADLLSNLRRIENAIHKLYVMQQI